MIDILAKMCAIGNELGTVTSAMMYDHNYITIEGETKLKKQFSLTLHIKEEEKDGN